MFIQHLLQYNGMWIVPFLLTSVLKFILQMEKLSLNLLEATELPGS